MGKENGYAQVRLPSGEYREIKRAESYDDLLGTYVF